MRTLLTLKLGTTHGGSWKKPTGTLLALTLLMTVLTSGCVMYPGISGSGTLVTETRAVNDFDAVSVGGAGQIRITQGDTESLEVTADDNLLPFLRTEVVQGELKIWWDRNNMRFSKGPVYVLGVKNLEKLRLSGSLRAEMDRLTTESFDGRISGSGKIELGHLETQKVQMHVSGSGDLLIGDGRADTMEISISGSGHARMPEFEVDAVEISISGSGNAEVHAKKSLDARVSGSGNVTYLGSPQVHSSVSGSGRVRSGAR